MNQLLNWSTIVHHKIPLFEDILTQLQILSVPREMCLRGNGPGGSCNTEIVIWINCTKFITTLITINKLTSYGM
jgi:hypothetical protein